MKKQIIEFAVKKTDGVVQVDKSAILQPKTNFKGGSVKWYKDRAKKKTD